MAVKKKAAPRKKTVSSKKSVSRKKPATRKKTIAKRLKSRGRKKSPLVLSELKKNLLGILILVSICLTAAMVADILLGPEQFTPEETEQTKTVHKAPDKKPKKAVPAQKDKKPVAKEKAKDKTSGQVVQKSIEYEVFKDIAPVIIEKPPVKVVDKTPRIAIIIDDIGYDRKIALALFDLHPNITFSILPFSPYGRDISKKLHAKGAQLMLHLPMEPTEYPDVNPGPGAILSSMSPDQLLAQLKKDINDIPHIKGVNNHMGSKITANSAQMNQIFTILKKEQLFFIDSKTAPKSQGKASARLLNLQFAQRDVFLDNFQDIEYITGQFKQLIRIANKHGSAIGIGHPYKATLDALEQLLPKLKKTKVVRASELTHIPS